MLPLLFGNQTFKKVIKKGALIAFKYYCKLTRLITNLVNYRDI